VALEVPAVDVPGEGVGAEQCFGGFAVEK